ncbi:S8 family serine peptidase [Pedobacter jejuensis]|uniref:Peptidase S8 n=1 Tax=Pedobacter jejuensis TaxID=1268550 RepID=A0A3N0BS06_9SPHI|nr:S8 family serine peptidase [Pedobacter jejuensis]RNL51819.1 peptidase S8 [Pedobacter jejuensis]
MNLLCNIRNLLSLAILTCCLQSLAQTPIKNWQLLDHEKDGVYGIGVEKAYSTLLKNKKPKKKVLVAIIDVGMDITHPAFRGAIWTNQKEIAGNGRDDDGNGYVDDVHGWNFMGECKVETYDCIREYVKFKSKYERLTDTLTPGMRQWTKIKTETESFLKFRERIFNRTEPAIVALSILNAYWKNSLKADSVYIGKIIHSQLPAGIDSNVIKAQKEVLTKVFPGDTLRRNALTLQAVINGYQNVVDLYKGEYLTAKTIIEQNDAGYFRKKSPGDDPYTNTDIHYGNSNTTTTMPHGNGVAGIIAASRTNPDMKGIADWVELMPISIVSQKVIGEERDKDVANAIRYAVDNGAAIINFSLGKKSSPQKILVDESIRYAASKGVLLFAAAGNDASDNDLITDYPSAYFDDGSVADNVFKVGATTSGPSLVWKFSNYGKKNVDFFAPGDDIYSTALNSSYNRDSGTSYASPTAAGLAALIWSYYPNLTYKEVAKCITHSVEESNVLVTKPGSNERVPFKALSRLGGMINAYKALLFAATIH